MTTGQIVLMTGLYLAVFVAVAYCTRAKLLRIAGAAIYALLVVVGHAVIRMVAGPARGDSLAARP